jgi:hypothetical protein
MAAVMKKCCAQVLKASSAETSENAEQDLCLALSLLVSRLLQATRNGHPPKRILIKGGTISPKRSNRWQNHGTPLFHAVPLAEPDVLRILSILNISSS